MNDNEIDLSALDPARNGTLEALQRIEQNTESLAKNIARETAANIRTLRRMQSRQLGGERQPLVPGATVAPVPEVDSRARVTRARTRAPEGEQPGTPEPAEAVATPERVTQARQRRTNTAPETQPEQPAPRTATPEPVATPEQPERTRQPRRQRQQDAEPASQPEQPSQPQRGANGRFQSRAEQALEERQQEQQEQQRTRTLADVLREGLDVGGSVLEGGDAKDAVGAAVGGPVYAAAQELKGAYDELADEESWSGKLIRKGLAKVGKNGDRERLQDAEHHAEAMGASEASRAAVEEVRQAGEQSVDAIEAQTELQRRQHQEQMDALDRVSQSAANGGGGGTTILGGLKGALGGAAAKAGGFLKGAGGKVLGGLGAALAGIFAYSAKSDELAQREDLTESQKTAQAAATGIGAGGGALAGAAGGAAAGAAIGSVIPGFGTLVGGVVGSIAGGIAGAWGGEKLGEAVGEAVSDTMDSVEEEAAKILEERDAEIERQASEVSSRGFKLFSPSTWFGGGGDDKAAVSDRGRSSAPPSLRGTDAEILASTGLGRVSEKYESGGRGVATISTGKGDAGGVSYGKHQLASKTGTMQAFLNSKEGEAYRARFAGQEAGSAQFNETYKQVVAEDADGFADAQHAFIKRTHFDPVAQYAKAKGIDVNDQAIQEALWSQSVQHSGKGNRKIIDDAAARAGEGAGSEQVINALYDARTDYASQFASRAATTDRYMRERQDVLAIARQGSQQAESGEMVAEAGPQQPAAEQPAQRAPEGQQDAIGSRVAEPAPEGQPSIAVAGQPSGVVSSMTPVASLVAAQQPAAVAPAALAARADAVVPMQAPEPVRAPMQAQPQQQAFDPRTISAEIAKAVASAVTQASSSDSKKTDQIKPGDAKATQEVAANIPMEFDDMLMMLVAHDRV